MKQGLRLCALSCFGPGSIPEDHAGLLSCKTTTRRAYYFLEDTKRNRKRIGWIGMEALLHTSYSSYQMSLSEAPSDDKVFDSPVRCCRLAWKDGWNPGACDHRFIDQSDLPILHHPCWWVASLQYVAMFFFFKISWNSASAVLGGCSQCFSRTPASNSVVQSSTIIR